MSTDIGTISDRDTAKIELDVYTSNGVTLLIRDNESEEVSSFKIRLDETAVDDLITYLQTAKAVAFRN